MRFRRRPEKLTYSVPAGRGLSAMVDTIYRANGRRSNAEWRRACEASMIASRRRRGLDPDVRFATRDIPRFFFVDGVPERLMHP
jgi:hypothetical protein